MSAFKNGWTKALTLAQNAEQKLQTGKEIYERILTTKLLKDKEFQTVKFSSQFERKKMV